MSSHDRINELYRGEIFTPETQRIARDRIHWMVAQMRGNRVLDVGCSQGIATVLCAREGASVVGVDSHAELIETAERELAEEPPEVRERVRLMACDLFAADLGEERFDTVLLGEILEHQANPRRLFQRASSLVDEGGILVVTTPFGLHVHDDHKHTFYVLSFLETVRGLCSPQSLDIVDEYIRFTASHPSADPGMDVEDYVALMRLEERAMERAEWDAYRGRVERNQRIRKLTDSEARAKEQLKVHRKGRSQVQAELDKVRRDNSALAKENGAQRQQIRALQQQVSSLREAAKAAKEAARISAKDAGKRDNPQGTASRGGPLTRGTRALWSSIGREMQSGRLQSDPTTAVKKTYARVRRATFNLPHPTQPAAPPHSPGPSPRAPRHDKSPREGAITPDDLPPYAPSTEGHPTKVTIATILDDFSYHCLRDEAELVPLSTKGWREEMETAKPAFLLVESAWRGNDAQWRYLLTKYVEREENPLRDLLAWCGERGIPRVFWNKEDPPNFDVFMDVAKDFDHIFTTDAHCIPKYRRLTGHDRAYPLPFAAQPTIHNPIQDQVKRDQRVCFAGSWRADKYPERSADTAMLLKPAIAHGLDVFDRNYGSPLGQQYAFPPPYDQYVRGSVGYDRMLSAYRAYDVFLNVNSVKDSPTMFSRRVFELLACGTAVVSTPSAGIERMFGTLVPSASDSQQAERHLTTLLGDRAFRNRMAHAGYRHVLENHTYRHRLQTILQTVGVPDEATEESPPRVSILAATNRPEQLENVLANVRRQVHPSIELIILLNSDEFDQKAVEERASKLTGIDLQVHQLEESYTLADCLNHGIDRASGDYLAKFDDDDHYGAHYLSDLLLTRLYTDAPIVGKRAYFCYVTQSDRMAIRFPTLAHKHVDFVNGATWMARRDVFDEVRFTPVRQGTDTIFYRNCRSKGMSIYSADPYNYVAVRHGAAHGHTWAIDDQEFLSQCEPVQQGLDMGLVMI